MENKEIKIIPPKGYEIDKENSTFECIKFKPKSLTYGDVAKSLFKDKGYFYTNSYGIIDKSNGVKYSDPNNAISEKQLEKLLAINKLMNVAKYLNGDWKPNWEDNDELKWCIIFKDRAIGIVSGNTYYTDICFKSINLAQQAINILGEDTIRLALSTDW